MGNTYRRHVWRFTPISPMKSSLGMFMVKSAQKGSPVEGGVYELKHIPVALIFYFIYQIISFYNSLVYNVVSPPTTQTNKQQQL